MPEETSNGKTPNCKCLICGKEFWKPACRLKKKACKYCSWECYRSVAWNADNFWSHVNKKGPDDCWEWTAFITAKGYGMCWHRERGNRHAHRIAYELHHGVELPEEVPVLHKCPIKHNKKCCNPAHLKPSTHQENADDTVLFHQRPLGEEVSGAKLTSEKVRKARELKAQGISVREITRILDVPYFAIWNALKGVTWKHVK